MAELTPTPRRLDVINNEMRSDVTMRLGRLIDVDHEWDKV